MTERTHYVYRCYDASGALLYVGCTKDPAARRTAHRHSLASSWFADVARVKLCGPYPKDVAFRIERETQIAEGPKWGLTPTKQSVVMARRRRNREHTARLMAEGMPWRQAWQEANRLTDAEIPEPLILCYPDIYARERAA